MRPLLILKCTVLFFTLLFLLERKQVRMKTDFKDKLNEYNRTKAVETAFDEVQRKLKCCGVDNSSDWGKAVPKSCCISVVEDHCPTDDAFAEGCWEKVNEVLFRSVNRRLAVHVFGCIIKVVGSIYACFVANVMKNKKKLRARRCYEQRQEADNRKKEYHKGKDDQQNIEENAGN